MHQAQNQSAESAPTTQKVEVLKIRFDLRLRPNQIYKFRGAIAAAAGWENNLFHNHGYRPSGLAKSSSVEQPGVAKLAPKEAEATNLEDAKQVSETNLSKAVFYRYPLIQYRSEGGYAAIWAMGEGINALRNWMNNGLTNFRMGGRKYALKITDFKGENFYLKVSDTMQTYRLMDWLALNSDNYQRWQSMEDYSARIILLEEILAGHLLSFATAAQWQIPQRFEVKLWNVRNCRPMMVHGTERIAFTILYKTNLLLPANIAVGRSTAFGFGVQQPTKAIL